jgi:DNA-binding NtrC family response regulator
LGPDHDLHRWLAASPSLIPHLKGIERAAASDTPILVLGESGTGRSSLVRALHAGSGRRAGPLIEVDPGVVPVSLFDSDLFGHRRGAFTGATGDAAGRVERAARGSLVLDHVEELPLLVQPKLLRLLSEQRYSPLGGRERKADVRFFAVGPTDLHERVQRGLFRSDLYFRLEVLRFVLPPIRQRTSDLPSLIAALLEDLAIRLERPVLRLSDRALAWMKVYSWPGNLRQLRNVLERALILADGEILDPPIPRDGEESMPRPLVEVEQLEIRKALAFARGHQGRAAELLGISRKALWEKRRRFGIP